MISSYRDEATEDLRNGIDSRKARKRLPSSLWRVAQRKFDMLQVARTIEELRSPPGNRLERLRGDRAGQYSIRINQQYRLCFGYDGRTFSEVEVVDYH